GCRRKPPNSCRPCRSDFSRDAFQTAIRIGSFAIEALLHGRPNGLIAERAAVHAGMFYAARTLSRTPSDETPPRIAPPPASWCGGRGDDVAGLRNTAGQRH